jgi:hypothetical protein
MPVAMRHVVRAEMTVTVTADDGTVERFAVEASARSGFSGDSSLAEAFVTAFRRAEEKAIPHSEVVRANEKARLK